MIIRPNSLLKYLGKEVEIKSHTSGSEGFNSRSIGELCEDEFGFYVLDKSDEESKRVYLELGNFLVIDQKRRWGACKVSYFYADKREVDSYLFGY